MLDRDPFDFDDIVCPNSFEDDPGVDAFFDRIIHISKSDVLGRNPKGPERCKSTARIREAVVSDTARSFVQRRIHALSGETNPRPSRRNLEVVVNRSGTEERLTPVPQMMRRTVVEPLQNRRAGSRFMKQKDESLAEKRTELDDRVERHTCGRWSIPTAESLTQSVDPEEVKVAQVTQLRSREAVKTKNGGLASTVVTVEAENAVPDVANLRLSPRGSMRGVRMERPASEDTKMSRKQAVPMKVTRSKNEPRTTLHSDQQNKSKLKAASSKATKATNISVEKPGSRPKALDNVGKTLAQLVSEFQTCLRQCSNSNRLRRRRPAWQGYF